MPDADPLTLADPAIIARRIARVIASSERYETGQRLELGGEDGGAAHPSRDPVRRGGVCIMNSATWPRADPLEQKLLWIQTDPAD